MTSPRAGLCTATKSLASDGRPSAADEIGEDFTVCAGCMIRPLYKNVDVALEERSGAGPVTG